MFEIVYAYPRNHLDTVWNAHVMTESDRVGWMLDVVYLLCYAC